MSVSHSTADVRDMLVVHESFRQEFARIPDLVSGVAPGDLSRTRVVAEHLDLMVQMLHLHHKGEDDLLWPKLLERAPQEVTALIPLMEKQHGAIDVLLRRADEELTRWRATADAADRDTLAATLKALEPALAEHLETEESRILTVVPQYLTSREWLELGDHAIAGLPKSKLPAIFGMIARLAEPDVIALMISTAPLVPRLIVPKIGVRAYERYVRRVYGGEVAA
jgi:hemerythrin-like domain-containing protein